MAATASICFYENMSDSNVGGRKQRNIRNHLFMVYGVINSVMHGEGPPVDLQIYDLAQCFDSMYLSDTMNDVYDTLPPHERDDQLSLTYKMNRENLVAVRTSYGLTDRVKIKDIVMQGAVMAPIEASVSVDKIGKECEERGIHLYRYKQLVDIMPLSMVDDLLAIAECGHKSVATNTFINAKIEMKKLDFNVKKCHQIHVGKNDIFCPTLQVHGESMSVVTEDSYLGDIVANHIQVDGSNSKNVAARYKKGISMGSQIMAVLQTVTLGNYYSRKVDK